jgi:hypothetical protein
MRLASVATPTRSLLTALTGYLPKIVISGIRRQWRARHGTGLFDEQEIL